jgi:hypothetical protein
MKKILIALLFLLGLGSINAQTKVINSKLQVNVVDEGVVSDSILVRGSDKVLKYVKKSVLLTDYLKQADLTAANTSLDDTDLVVAPATELQGFADKVDEALLKARGTGVSSTYFSGVTVDGTTFTQGSVKGEINSDEGYFSIDFGGSMGVTISDLTSVYTYVYVDKSGFLQQQNTIPTRQDFTRKIFTMRILVDTVDEEIISFEYLSNPLGHYANSQRDLYSYLLAAGIPLKKDQVVTGRAGDLGFDVSAGSFMEFGGTGNINDPNTPDLSAVTNADFVLTRRTTLNGGGTTDLPKFWDNNGTLTALGSTTLVGHRLYRFSNGDFYLQYGQGNYANMSLAKTGVRLEEYELNPALKSATFFGWWIIESTATNTGGTTLTDFVEYTIGVQGGSSNSLSGAVLKGNNGSDFVDIPQTRTNLGLGNFTTPSTFTGNLLLTATQSDINLKAAGKAVEILGDSSQLTGDPAFRVKQDGDTKVDFGWDDEGTSEAFVWNYSNGGFKIGVNNLLAFNILTDLSAKFASNISLTNSSWLTGRNVDDTVDVLLIGLDANNKVKIDPNLYGTLISGNAMVGNDLTVVGELSVMDVATFTSTVTALSIEPTALTTGNVPYKSAGALLDSPISTDGTNVTLSGNNDEGIVLESNEGGDNANQSIITFRNSGGSEAKIKGYREGSSSRMGLRFDTADIPNAFILNSLDGAAEFASSVSATNGIFSNNVLIGDYSGAFTPTKGLLIEAEAGSSSYAYWYTTGASVFSIASDGSKSNIGWGSGFNKEVNITNTGAGAVSVGINTDTPQSTLDVNGSVSATDLKLDNTSGSIINLKRNDAFVSSNVVIGSIDFETTDNSDSGVNARIKVVKQDLSTGDVPMAIVFETGVSNVTTEAFRLDSEQKAIFTSSVSATDYKVTALNTAPSSASSTGTTGEIRYTADYIYVCTATNTWKRSAVSTW